MSSEGYPVRVQVTLAVEVEVTVRFGPAEAGRLVETACMAALEAAGYAPVSLGASRVRRCTEPY